MRAWRRVASRAGTRCTCSTSSACARRSIAASNATACSSRTSASAGSRRSAASSASAVPGPPHDRTGLTLEGLKLLKAYQRLDIEAIAELRLAGAVEREVEAALRDFVGSALEREARSLAFLDEVRQRPAAARRALMADGRAARHRHRGRPRGRARASRRAPGQERYLGSMIEPLRGRRRRRPGLPRMWSVHDGDGSSSAS